MDENLQHYETMPQAVITIVNALADASELDMKPATYHQAMGELDQLAGTIREAFKAYKQLSLF